MNPKNEVGMSAEPVVPGEGLLEIMDEIVDDYDDYISNGGPRARELLRKYRKARPALPAPEPPRFTTAMLAAALDDVFETTQWEGKGASIAPGLYAALKSHLGAALPAEHAPPEPTDFGTCGICDAPLPHATDAASLERAQIVHDAWERFAEPCAGPNSHAEYNSLVATAEALASENDALRRDLAAHAAGTATIESLTAKYGTMDVALGGHIVGMLAEMMVLWFDDAGGDNYVEVRLRDRKSAKAPREFVLTMQRANGKTPHELLEAERARGSRPALAGSPDAMRAAWDYHLAHHGIPDATCAICVGLSGDPETKSNGGAHGLTIG